MCLKLSYLFSESSPPFPHFPGSRQREWVHHPAEMGAWGHVVSVGVLLQHVWDGGLGSAVSMVWGLC